MDKATKRKLNKLKKDTKMKMETIGTYQPSFDSLIERYAEMTLQHGELQARWYEDGCAITEEYTNKFGATNERKTITYAALEKMRIDLLTMENVMGLTPKGLKQIRARSMEGKKESALGKALEMLDG